MHVWFRQYAQQMGMQNVRAILPEQIDLCINTSITDTINTIIQENVATTNDRVVTDNSKIGSINALNTLYKVAFIDMSPELSSKETRLFNFIKSDRLTGRMTTNFVKLDDDCKFPNYLYLVDFSINYKKVKQHLGYNGFSNVTKTYKILSNTITDPSGPTAIDITFDSNTGYTTQSCTTNIDGSGSMTSRNFRIQNDRLQCVDSGYATKFLALKYVKGKTRAEAESAFVLASGSEFTNNVDSALEGTTVIVNPLVVESQQYVQPSFDEEGLETNYFPVRIIDDVFLADTLNDFVLKNRLRSPIIVSYNNNKDDKNFDLYIDKFVKVSASDGSERYVLANDLIPYKLRMAYIAYPAEVKYDEDLTGNNVDCDLPEYMHVDILKHAVDLYRIAVTGSLQAQRQQEQNAQQENVRNNYRNEGTQQ